ncbi:hypothetical protein PanWU01x14_058100 [Parasponia andersonii]|uniref:Uncharacterized protein n=1 Tax=Parasponia andersonii TaxID=3476 RepID=A0A2P5DJ53_PARAD|nr:hypothetical protein PanWU01x14_058100 [Parasponia andersonii]
MAQTKKDSSSPFVSIYIQKGCPQDKKDSSSPPRAKKLRSKRKRETRNDEFSNPPVNTVENDNSPKKVVASEAKEMLVSRD